MGIDMEYFGELNEEDEAHGRGTVKYEETTYEATFHKNLINGYCELPSFFDNVLIG